MSDIVPRLRDWLDEETPISVIMNEAADEITRLTVRVEELEGQHKGLVIQNALLRQRPDLPVDRIPAVRDVEALVARVQELEGDLNIMRLQRDAKRWTASAARVEELEGALEAWDDAVRIDVLMEGPRYMGVSSTLGRKAWEMTRAALHPAEPALNREVDWGPDVGREVTAPSPRVCPVCGIVNCPVPPPEKGGE